jgi:hypothetical protein
MRTKLYDEISTRALTLITFLLLIPSSAHAQVTNIPGPVGSAGFGLQMVTLPNGNFIVTDPFYDEGGTTSGRVS